MPWCYLNIQTSRVAILQISICAVYASSRPMLCFDRLCTSYFCWTCSWNTYSSSIFHCLWFYLCNLCEVVCEHACSRIPLNVWNWSITCSLFILSSCWCQVILMFNITPRYLTSPSNCKCSPRNPPSHWGEFYLNRHFVFIIIQNIKVCCSRSSRAHKTSPCGYPPTIKWSFTLSWLVSA